MQFLAVFLRSKRFSFSLCIVIKKQKIKGKIANILGYFALHSIKSIFALTFFGFLAS
jgi:hypothetical protein